MNKLKKGYTLISVIVVLAVMLVVVLFASDALFSELAIAKNQKAATSAFNLAEAGVSEAIWRIQNDTTTKNTFLSTTNGQTTFSHASALVNGGSYSVTIQNSARATADITSTGYLAFGNKTAQRKIVVSITKATTPPPYNYDGAIFTGGAQGDEDITISNATFTVTGTIEVDDDDDPETPPVDMPYGSLLSSRDIWLLNSTVSVAKDILANRNILTTGSTISYGGTINDYDTVTLNMPALDVTSESVNSYKSLAIAQNQYYTTAEFNDLVDDGPITLNGIVYVAGTQGINMDHDENVTVNGVLISEGSIDLGKPNQNATLRINHVDGQPSGIITLDKLTVWAGGALTVNGLVYVGDRFSFDPYRASFAASRNLTITGGILARRFNGNGPRIVTINFNQDYINEALLPNPNETPIIQTNHWEEEY